MSIKSGKWISRMAEQRGVTWPEIWIKVFTTKPPRAQSYTK